MLIFSILVLVGFIVYRLTNGGNSNSNNFINPIYKNLVNEDKYRFDVVADIKSIVERSLSICKESGFNADQTDMFLVKAIAGFKVQLKNIALANAISYRISVVQAHSIIDEMCDGALANYVINPLLKS